MEKGISIEETLKDRGAKYGAFKGHSNITQALKRIMRESPNWNNLTDDKAEALDMIQHKVGRILNGDPEYHDSWFDIIGYTKLVADSLQETINPTTKGEIKCLK